MSQQRDMIILLSLSLTVSVCAISFLVGGQSTHEKDGLQAWLGDLNGTTAESYSRASEAVREMGTNAIPELMSLLQREDSGMEKELSALVESQGMISMRMETALDRQWEALKGFEILGSNAVPALDMLVGLLEQGKHPEVIPFAIAGLGEAGMAPLQAALTNKNQLVRGNAASALSTMDQDVKEVVGKLVGLLSDANAHVREAAASALGILGSGEQQITVPALEVLLDDRDGGVRSAAFHAISLLIRR